MKSNLLAPAFLTVTLVALLAGLAACAGEDPDTSTDMPPAETDPSGTFEPGGGIEVEPAKPPKPEDFQLPDGAKNEDGEVIEGPTGMKPIAKNARVWFDAKKHVVVVDGEVCLTKGQLEMFACPKNTKEHESIVMIDGLASHVHAALLFAGAVSGKPVKFDPEYIAATGDEIEVWVLWKDSDGKRHKALAQEWIKDTKTGKQMAYDWVFPGSGFFKDETTGETIYHGDGGDFICVSNFPTATLDIPIESPQANTNLLFEAFTDRIPPKGTKVRLVLRPKRFLEKTDDNAEAKQEEAEADKQALETEE